MYIIIKYEEVDFAVFPLLRDAITELRYTPKAVANIRLILSFTSVILK